MSELNYRPRVKDGVTVQGLGDEVMLYDPEKDNIHVLNNTACSIWNLCDGQHTIDEILTNMKKEFPDVPQSELKEDIENTVEELKKKQLLV